MSTKPRLRRWFTRFLQVLGVIVILSVFVVFRLQSLNATPLKPENFTTFNKIEIYSLGLLMSIVAYPLYPEVAKEHLMLYRPFDGKPKTIEDDFFLRSKTVQAAIRKSLRTGNEVRLWWPTGAYTLTFNADAYWEARISLAFNGGWLFVENGMARVRVPIAYPPKAFAPLIKIPYLGTIGVEEGLFHILQRAGWYHTGEAHWVAKI